MKVFIIVLALYLFLIPGADAQISIELDNITVTASRISTDIAESGKNVSVFTARDIQQMPVTSVDELIRTLPGININSRQGFGVQADVGIRGSTYNQVLFMLDNVPMNDPLTAHFNTNIPVSLSEIGQVEVIRGPASASFGADAVGGVVHIKTKMYMEREVNKSGNRISHFNADVAGGQNNLQMGDISAEFQGSRWRAGISARGARSDGETLANPGFEAGVSDSEQYENYFNLANANASLSVRISDNWSWYARAGIDDRDFSARYFYTRSEFDESNEQIQSRWILSALTRDSGNHRTELNASLRRVDDTFDFNSRIGIPVNHHTTDQLYLNLSHQLNTGNIESFGITSSNLMIGGSFTGKQIESTDRGDHSDKLGGIYLIAHLKYGDGLNVTASSRLQFDQFGNNEFLPQLSSSYKMGQITFRSSLGRAIRIGDYTERFISSQIPDLTPGRNIGNPDLMPERSWSADAGFDWRLAQSTIFSPTVFYRSSENLIDYVLTNSNEISNADNLQPDEEYFYARNISSTETAGVEFLASHTFSLGDNRAVRLDGVYTYIHTTGSSGEVSKYIANHPLHQVTVGVRLSTSRFLINSNSSYRVRNAEAAEIIGAEVPSGYFVTNLNLEYSPDYVPGAVYLQVLNITDNRYQEILGAPMPGRWIMGGLRIRLR